MTEDDIYPLIADIAGGQVYPYVVPLNKQGVPAISPPWVVFSLPSTIFGDVFCGTAESAISLQVDVYALSNDEARAIRNSVLTALSPLSPTEIILTPGYEPDTKLYRATLEASFTD